MRLFLEISLKGIYSFLTDVNYRTFIKLVFSYGGRERYKEIKISFLNYNFVIPDALSFIWQFKEIFVDKNYLFNSDNSEPIIYDCGSNIGTSVLFFKNIYPGAKIKAFEAEPNIFEYLKQNLELNSINNVELFMKAVWINNDGVEFSSEGADGSSIFGEGIKQKVESIRLKDFIEKESHIDFLKMDIEGAETEVLMDCREVLHKVKNVFIEYHSFINQKQKLDAVLSILSENGFRYFVNSAVPNKHPFLKKKNTANPDMDLQTNIYAFK